VKLFLCLALSFVCAGENEVVRRVYSHLLIQDFSSAVIEAQKARAQFPDSKAVQMAYLRALSERGDDTEVLRQWHETVGKFEDVKTSRHTLEALAWGVLQKGEASQQLAVRFCSLLGAALTHDVRAVSLICAEMKGTNTMLRSLAVKLAVNYGDGPMQLELARMLKEEKVWHVRLEVIQAIGMLRMIWMREELKEIVANPKTLADEKAAAILALVSMYDSIGPDELKTLLASNRAGLRQFACDLIAALDLEEYVPELVKLTKDASPDVRQQALYGLGLLRAALPLKEFEPLLRDSSPGVAITAGWAALLAGHVEGGETLELWMHDPHSDLRRLASAALSATGKAGIDIAARQIEKHPDPYVRANLAIGLIGQRQHIDLATNCLYSVLRSEHETLWMWDSRFPFRSLSPSFVAHNAQIPNYPRVVDQLVRLDILTILSVMRHPLAQDAVKGFLREGSWGVTGAAAATLVEEGDEEALSLIRGLLGENDPKVRIQAALILALLGGDPAGMKVLIEAYPKADREMKIHILEAIGRIGDAETIPFLVEVFKEPFQLMRVVAASALIQSLYH